MDSNIREQAAHEQSESRDAALRERFKRQVRLESDLSNIAQDGAAYDLHIDRSLISHWGSMKGCDMPAWRLIGWTQVYGPALLAWVARQCGGAFLHQAPVDHLEASPGKLTGMLAHEVGDVVQQVFQDIADGIWSGEERKSRVAALRKIELIAKSLREDAEGGDQ